MSEELVSCPYDPLHKLTRKRLIPHILTCEKLYPNVELQTCPLNSTHRERPENMVKHLASCPDRMVVTNYMAGGIPEDEERIVQEVLDVDENWDAVEHPEPQKEAKANILRQPDGLPSERRAILRQEADAFVPEIPKREESSDDDYANNPVQQRKRPEIKFNRIKRKNRLQRTNIEDDSDEVSNERPPTPPPPFDLNWSETSTKQRDRSRSPFRY